MSPKTTAISITAVEARGTTQERKKWRCMHVVVSERILAGQFRFFFAVPQQYQQEAKGNDDGGMNW